MNLYILSFIGMLALVVGVYLFSSRKTGKEIQDEIELKKRLEG